MPNAKDLIERALKNVPNGRPTPFPVSTTKKWRPIIARYQSSIRKQRSQNTNRRTDVCCRRCSRDSGQPAGASLPGRLPGGGLSRKTNPEGWKVTS